MATIFQHEIATNFIYPFLLIFFIIFALLEKTKLLGEGKKQINALIAFVIGLIFVTAVFPKVIVGNLMLFLTVALVVVFVVLLLWGFVFGKSEGFEPTPGMKITLGIIIGIAVIVTVIWATGVGGGFFDALFGQSWSEAFWTNFFFVLLIAAALAIAIGSKNK